MFSYLHLEDDNGERVCMECKMAKKSTPDSALTEGGDESVVIGGKVYVRAGGFKEVAPGRNLPVYIAEGQPDERERGDVPLAYELMGVVADVEQGNGFDAVCLETIKRVMNALLEKKP
jgi:hypothetical protein